MADGRVAATRTLVAWGLVGLACASTAVPGGGDAASDPLAARSVVRVECILADSRSLAHGSGFLHKSGWVVSTDQVLEDCRTGRILLLGAQGKFLASETIRDPAHDLSLIKPDRPIPAPALSIAETDPVVPGERVQAWGFPAGYEGSKPVVANVVLAGEEVRDGRAVYTIEARPDAGISGGPLVRKADRAVIGVTIFGVGVVRLAPDPFVGVAVTLDDLRRFLLEHEIEP